MFEDTTWVIKRRNISTVKQHNCQNRKDKTLHTKLTTEQTHNFDSIQRYRSRTLFSGWISTNDKLMTRVLISTINRSRVNQ